MVLNPSNKLALYLLPLTALLTYFIYQAYFFDYSDFAAYHFGSKEILEGNYQTTYDTYSLNLAIYEKGYKNVFISYSPFTPFTALIYAPFSSLNIALAKLLFNILSSGLFLATLYRTFKYFNITPTLLLLIPIIFFIPLRNNLNFGQSYLLLIVLFIEGFIAFKKKKLLLSSLLWGIAILFKVFPIVIVIYLLLKREFKAASLLIIICFLLLLASLFIIGYHPWQLYAQLLPRLNEGELNNSFTPQFQSFFMLVKNVCIYDKLLNPRNIFSSQIAFVLLNVLFKTLIISSAIAFTFSKKIKELTSFGIWVLASILISPNGSTYSLILLLIPLLGTYSTAIKNSDKLLNAALTFIICNLPITIFLSMLLPLQFPRLYFMIALFISLLMIVNARPNLKILAGTFILLNLSSLPLFFKKPDEGNYLLGKETHLLIHNISIINDKLAYAYWSKEGSQKEITDKYVSSFDTQNVRLVNNQLYYNNRKLTNSSDWKKNPILINNEEIVYLSDKNRGIGFYTIRTIRLQ